MTAAFSQDISVFLSLLYTSDVYPRCCNVLEAYPSQEKAHLTDIRQVRGGYPSQTSVFKHFPAQLPPIRPFQTFTPPRTYSYQ